MEQKHVNMVAVPGKTNLKPGLCEADSPYVYPFKYKGYNFLLDLHTNRLFSLTNEEANVMERWGAGIDLTAIAGQYPKEVAHIQKMRRQGLFSCERPDGLAFGTDWSGVVDKIKYERVHTVIEITQRCNLRCGYCTFGGGFKDHRTLGPRSMSLEILEKTIEDAFVHGDRLNEIAIGFYGGEPLVEFNLLKAAVSFADKMCGGKKVRFSVTTNATLIDKKKACFLRDAGFAVLVSIDGPKDMHDRHRVYSNGEGSYDSALKGLKTLIDTYPSELHGKISLNMVVPSPDWIPNLKKLWDAEPWLPRYIRAQANKLDPPSGFILPPPTGQNLGTMREEWISDAKCGKSGKTTLDTETFDMTLARLHKRPVFSKPRKTFFPNGCCIPGARKIYVRLDGTYQICERAHGVPTIGSVTTGIDYEGLNKIVDEYSRLSFSDCKNCFAVSVCGVCFIHAYENGSFNIKKKRNLCTAMRKSRSTNLKIYGLISQECPHKLEEWDYIEIK